MDFSTLTNREDKLEAHIKATKSFHPDSWISTEIYGDVRLRSVQHHHSFHQYHIFIDASPLSPLSLRFHHSGGFLAQHFHIVWRGRASQCHHHPTRGTVARVKSRLSKKRRGGRGVRGGNGGETGVDTALKRLRGRRRLKGPGCMDAPKWCIQLSS